MLVHRVALTLRAGATLAFVAALALLAKPSAVASLVGFRAADITPGFLWALRALGLSMLVIAVLAPLIASFGGERGLRQTASAMVFFFARPRSCRDQPNRLDRFQICPLRRDRFVYGQLPFRPSWQA